MITGFSRKPAKSTAAPPKRKGAKEMISSLTAQLLHHVKAKSSRAVHDGHDNRHHLCGILIA
jgi:hypothetical protein